MSGQYDGKVRIGTKIDDSDLAGDLEKLKSRLQNASANLRDVMQGPVQAVKDIGRAFQQIGQVINSVENDWAAQEKAIAINKATLKATGAETWTTAEAQQALADKLQKVTGYADEEVLAMQNVLLGFKNIKGDNFDIAAEQILNMSKVMGINLVSSAQAVGKALDDPIAGVDSLTRQGFRFSAQQKEVLKDLVNTGQIAKAQKIILDELATTYGGAAEAANNTSSAIKERLGVAVSELRERIGKFATEALAPSRRELTGFIEGLSKTFDTINANANAPEILMKLATGLGAATAGVAAFVLVSQGHTIVTALAKALWAVNNALAANPYALAGAALAALVVAIIGAKEAQEAHNEALKKQIEKSDEAQQEVKALADEYQNLYDKVNPSANEQDRMAEIAKILHERYPTLTTDTLNLAAANGTLAEKLDELSKAEIKRKAREELPGLESQVTKAEKELKNYTQILNKLKTLRDGQTYLGYTRFDIAKIQAIVDDAQQRLDIVKPTRDYYKNALNNIWPEPLKQEKAGTIETGGTATDTYIPKGESQGERLKDLDTEYKARKALAERNGEDTAAIEKKWYEARNRLLAEFVVEDSKKGIALQDSLASSLKNYTKEGTSELRTLGDEIVATQQKLAELKSVDIEKVLEKYAPPTSGPYSAAGYKYARQVYEQFEKGVLQSTKLSESQIKDQIDAMASGQKYRDERKAYFDKIALDEDIKRIAYESLPALEAEFASKPGARGQSGLAIENYVSRDDFIEQLASQLDELQKEFTTPQYGQSGINQREGAGGASIADQIAMLSEQVEQIELAKLEDMIAEYAVKPGSKGQSGITPEGVAIYGGDLADQLISEVIIPASLEAAQTGAMEYGKAYREGMAAWAKAKTVEDALAKMWDDVLNGLEAEYKERKPTFGQSGVVPEEIKPAPSIADQIREMQVSESEKQQEAADIWAESYERYLEEMARKASFFGPIVDDIKESWSEFSDRLKADVSDWTDVFYSARSALTDSFASAFETLGESIVTGTANWTSWGNSALRAFAQVLRALGYQLLAQAAYNAVLGVTHLLMGDFAGAAAAAASALVAGAAAAAAFIGAGIVEGLAEGAIEANRFTDALEEQNNALNANRTLWTLASKAADAYASVLTKVKGAASDFYASLQDVGKDITSTLIDSLVNGFSQEDFLYAMQEYIRSAVIKAAVYSESLMASVAEIGKKISTAIANGGTTADFSDLASELKSIWEAAIDKAAITARIVEEAFSSSYDIGSLSVKGDQYAKVHDGETILTPGLSEEARRAGIFIGPAENLNRIGAANIASKQQISLTLNLDGSITADGREIGRIAYRHFDEFAGSAYGG